MQSASSVKVVVGFIQVSVRQKISRLWESMKSETAAEWSGWRSERIFRVQTVKLVGPGLSSYINSNAICIGILFVCLSRSGNRRRSIEQ